MAQNLPPFSKWDETLEQLNYKIDGEGKLRKTADDDTQRNKLIDIMGGENGPGFKETLREPLEGALQREIIERIKACGLEERYLPGMTESPPGSPSVPIMITSLDKLKKKNHVIVLVASNEHNFCMFSYNYIIDSDGSIEFGSALGLAKKLQADGENAPGLIILNAGERIWSTDAETNMSHDSWVRRHFYARGKKPEDSAWDKKEHRIPESPTLGDHVKYALENLVDRSKQQLSFIIVGDAIFEMEESLQAPTEKKKLLGKYRDTIRSVAWVGRRPQCETNDDGVIKDLRLKSQAYQAVKGMEFDFINEHENPTTREKTLEASDKDTNGWINVPLVPRKVKYSYVMPYAYESVCEFIKNPPHGG